MLTLDELLAQKPDYIAEAASVQMVKGFGRKDSLLKQYDCAFHWGFC